MKKTLFKYNQGYTIIETMIAISIFLIVILYGVTALLNASMIQNKSEDMRSIMDNLSFVMEDMSRNIRTGYDYQCIRDGRMETNCEIGEGISFISPDNSQWKYYINSQGFLSKTVNGQEVVLTSPEIMIDPDSGFSVLGAKLAPLDEEQPMVRIRLKGEISGKGGVTSFSLQTSVSQRLIDILITEEAEENENI